MVKMSGSLSKLAEALHARQFPEIPSDKVFLEVDGEAIKRKLRLEERGRDRGKNDQPPTMSRQLDDVEQEICNIIASQLRDAETTFNNEMRSYADRLSTASLSPPMEIDLRSRNAIATFRAEAENELLQLELVRSISSIAFSGSIVSDDDGLRRPAHYPGRSRAFLQYGILAILLLFEIICNACFLGQGDDYGLAGGAVTALTVSFLNIGASYMLGLLGIRQLAHRNVLRKLGGLLLLGLWIGLDGWLNTMLAYFRELSTRNELAAAREAMTLALGGPGHLADFKSWVLLSIGIFFGFLALLDGYFAADRYPRTTAGSIDVTATRRIPISGGTWRRRGLYPGS